jgi:hypothetical protein
MHQYTERIAFLGREQKSVTDFLQNMDDWSTERSRLRKAGKKHETHRLDLTAKAALVEIGRLLFSVLRKGSEIRAERFDDMFGKDFELTLRLDTETRRFPWELAFDGSSFLASAYDVGRIVERPNEEYLSGYGPEYRKALVVGIGYKWCDARLDGPEREALSVKKRLEEKGYKVALLRGSEATREAIKEKLSQGVSVFHFSGHGAYRSRLSEGQKGSLLLSDGHLTEDDLKTCFQAAGGAPHLSFLNACQSAKEIYSSHIVDAFVEYGADFVIGTLWPVYDRPSTRFSERFYKEVVTPEQSVSHSLQLARWQFFGKRSFEEATTWPSFVLYGSPREYLARAP